MKKLAVIPGANLQQAVQKFNEFGIQCAMAHTNATYEQAMHSFEDDPQIELIIAEPVPSEGIGIAIMDRLRKAEYDWREAKQK